MKHCNREVNILGKNRKREQRIGHLCQPYNSGEVCNLFLCMVPCNVCPVYKLHCSENLKRVVKYNSVSCDETVSQKHQKTLADFTIAYRADFFDKENDGKFVNYRKSTSGLPDNLNYLRKFCPFVIIVILFQAYFECFLDIMI